MNPDTYLASLRFFLGTKLLLLTVMCFASLALPVNSFALTQGKGFADLNVAKSGDEVAPRGGNITYSVVVGNAGPDSANNVILDDPIPANTTFVNATVSQGTVSFDGTTVVANFGTIVAIESASLTLTVQVNNDTPRDTIITNIAVVRSGTADPDLSNNSGTAFTAVSGPFAGDLVISEFRLRGPGAVPQGIKGLNPGALNEFIEIYNNTGTPHFVNAGSGGENGKGQGGYAIVASDGEVRCTIPNGTVIPVRGHFLCVNSNGYSLSGYPAGNNTTATGDASYTADIPDNAGIALFNNNNGDYTLATRLDAVGSDSEKDPLYKEGNGYPSLSSNDLESSFYRDNCGLQGNPGSLQPCTITTGVIDTDNNATDFIFVDTLATSAGAGQRLGAPGPENLSSPIENNAQYTVGLLDPCSAGASAPNQVRDTTPDPQNNSSLGTIELRRTITNVGTAPATRLRFRVVHQTTSVAPIGTADLRLLTSSATEVTVDREPCGSETSDITVHGTTLEQPPDQPNGGAFNSTVSAISPEIVGSKPPSGRVIHGNLDLTTPLNPGESIDLRFLYGVQRGGKFRITLNVEVVEGEVQSENPKRSERMQRTTSSKRVK